MRLLNVHTFKLELFMGSERDIPPYAILSHTWEDEEVVFDDIQNRPLATLQQRPAFSKVAQTCRQAQRDRFDYVWIDTCCIDKSSSAELSEAINSMFKYYAQSSICYVYLSDFNVPCLLGAGEDVVLGVNDTSFFHSRWFDRGWTLQELIAPREVDFFDQYWRRFGIRDGSLRERICHRTGIWPHLFREPRCKCQDNGLLPMVREGRCPHCKTRDTLYQTLDSFAVSMKMSWAANRVTTRPEDSAYCLMGLFGINMPLLYGEGRKAFLRLQEQIIRQSKDQSILLWQAFRTDIPLSTALGCLAPSAGFFKYPVPIIGRRMFNHVERQYEADFMGRLAPMELTDTALITNLWICPCIFRSYDSTTHEFIDGDLWLGILDLAQDDDFLKRPAILLEHMSIVDVYRRVYNQLIIPVDPRAQKTTSSVVVDDARHDAFSPAQGGLGDHGTITITRDLSQAFKKDVKILLEQSPINAVKTQPSLERSPLTGPVYIVTTPHDEIEMTTDSGGSLSLLSSYDSRASQLAAPWVFARCLHTDADRFFGGLHFLELRFATKVQVDRDVTSLGAPTAEIEELRFAAKLRAEQDFTPLRASTAEIAVIWGMHGDKDEVNKKLDRDPTATPWKPWCRVFDMRLFMQQARTSTEDLQPNQLYGRQEALTAGEIHRRMEGQRKRLCLQGYEYAWLHSAKGPRKLFPDSDGDEWSQDVMPAVVEDENYIIDLITRVNRVEGLGRVLYELKLDIEVSDKVGWTPEMTEAQCAEGEKQDLHSTERYIKLRTDAFHQSRNEQSHNARGAMSRRMLRIDRQYEEKWRVRNRNRKDA